jgi:hypothetical protein
MESGGSAEPCRANPAVSGVRRRLIVSYYRCPLAEMVRFPPSWANLTKQQPFLQLLSHARSAACHNLRRYRYRGRLGRKGSLKARVVIYAYNHHVRLLSPEPMVVMQPQFTRVEEPTLLWRSNASCHSKG